MKFTFKMQRPTGRFKSFQPTYCDIKMGGDVCGSITKTSGVPKLVVRVMVKSKDPRYQPCGWKWVNLSQTFYTFDEAKDYVRDSLTNILKRSSLELHLNK